MAFAAAPEGTDEHFFSLRRTESWLHNDRLAKQLVYPELGENRYGAVPASVLGGNYQATASFADVLISCGALLFQSHPPSPESSQGAGILPSYGTGMAEERTSSNVSWWLRHRPG